MIPALIVTGALIVALVVGFVVIRQRADSAWRQVASDIGAEFVPGGLFSSSKVQAHIGQAMVTLDTYSVPSGDSSSTYTRMRAPLQNKDGFQFTVFREGLVARLDKKLGLQDIEIGVPDFDREFVIQANNESRVRTLLANAGIRELIRAQPRIRLGIVKGDLHFEAQGVIRDVQRLKSLFDLFGKVLDQLAG
jgi:hypothetical protein